MSNITRAERVERQQLDPGGPDDVVWVKGDYPTRRTDVYHDTRECRAVVPDEPYTDITRREARLKWYCPCLRCIVNTDSENRNEIEADGGTES